jgi:phage terminase small subunit
MELNIDKNHKVKPDFTKTRLRRVHFAREYMANGMDATKAALTVGYKDTPNTRFMASSLLKKPVVMAEIDKIQNKQLSRIGRDTGKITDSFAAIAYANVTDVYKTWTELKKFDELTDEQKNCISEIDVKSVTDRNGNTTDYIKIKFHDKLVALDKLAKMTGLYNEEENKSTQNIQINLVSDELAQKLNLE